jgi:hypothetical protein
MTLPSKHGAIFAMHHPFAGFCRFLQMLAGIGTPFERA